MEQFAEQFKDEFDCIEENMEKYITFSVPIKKKCDNSKTITYKLNFINSFIFMPTLHSAENHISQVLEYHRKLKKTT